MTEARDKDAAQTAAGGGHTREKGVAVREYKMCQDKGNIHSAGCSGADPTLSVLCV